MATPVCLPCIGFGCDNPDDLAAGVNGALYSALDYSFIVQCPEGCSCPSGLFPRTISILASTIPPVIPPILEPGASIILRLQGCMSLITRTLEAGASQSEIEAAAQSMQAEWAGQQASCIAAALPGVNCNTGTSVSICNDAQNFVCPYTSGNVIVAAGTYCQTLVTTGLTESQIASATAQIKDAMNLLAQRSGCPFLGILCSVTVTFSGAGNITNLNVHNVGANNFDTSSFQLCDSGGGSCFNSVQPTCGPGATVTVVSLSPYTIAFTAKYLGAIFASGPANGTGLNRTITIEVGC